MVFVLVAIIATAIIRLFKAFFVLIFRLLLSIVTTFWALARNLFSVTWVVALLIALIFFGVGVLFVEFQEESQTSIDAIYECGIFPAGEIGFSFFHYVWRLPYEFFATQWNDLLLFLYDSLGQIFEDIQNLAEIKKLYKEVKLLDQITEEIFDFDDGILGNIAAAIKAVFRLVRDTAIRFGDVIVCAQAWILKVIASLGLNYNFLNQQCTYCAMDPLDNGDTEFNCTLRNAIGSGPEPDCMECNDFLADWFGCAANTVDLFTFGIIEDKVKLTRIMRSVACLLGSFRPSFVIWTGLIDNLITDNCMGFDRLFDSVGQWFLSEDCGKPEPDINCELPGPDCKNCTDLPIGVIPCFNEFLRAVTDDRIDDFFAVIFRFVFNFIQKIIDSVNGIVECFNEDVFLLCLENFPIQRQDQEHQDVNAGFCVYDDDDDPIIPDGGIHECFNGLKICLDNPQNISLLHPLFQIQLMDFLLKDFWRYTIDLATCPISKTVECFRDSDCSVPSCEIDSDLENVEVLIPAFCVLCCIADEVPPFSPIALFAVDVLDFLAGVISQVIGFFISAGETFVCLFSCDIGPGGDNSFLQLLNCFDADSNNSCVTGNSNMKSIDPPGLWDSFLVDNNVYNDTFCGKILHSTNPMNVNMNDTGEYFSYWICLGIAGGVVPLKFRCDPELVDLGALYSAATMREGFQALIECRRHMHHKGKATKRSETFDQLNKTFLVLKDHAPAIGNLIGRIDTKHGVLPQLWSRYKASPFYSLTNEFVDRWQDINHQYSSNETGIVLREGFRSNKEQQQKDLYMLYVNAFLWNYRNRFAPGSFHKKSKELALPRISSLQEFQAVSQNYKFLTFGDLESQGAVALDLYQNAKSWKEDAPETFSVLGKVYGIVHKRFNFDESPWIQSIEAAIHTLKTNHFDEFLQWVKGEKGFLYDDGFVEPEHYNLKILQNRKSLNNSLFGYINGMYEPRRPRKLNLIPRDNHITFWSENISNVITSLRDERVKKRADLKEQGFSRTMRGTLGEAFDANQKLFDLVDSILVKVGINGSLNAVYTKIKTHWEGSDFETFWNKTKEFGKVYFDCAIPENIDGTEIYSPFCLNLLPESFFRFFALVPTKFFPVQVPWPGDLIAEPCVTTYNGNNDLFEFEFSNNCDLQNDTFADQRILCDFLIPCDFCLKEYRACGTAFCRFQNDTTLNADEMCDILGGIQSGGLCDINGELLPLIEQCDRLNGEFQSGFGDILDSLFYLLAAIPRILDFIVTGGIDLQLVETVVHLFLGVAFVVIVATSPIKLLLNLFSRGLIWNLRLWTIFVIFGNEIPIGLIFLLWVIRSLKQRPHFTFLLFFFYVILTVLIATWAVSLFITFPNLLEVFDIIGWLISALEKIRDFPLFFWINLNPLLLRLERFNFGTGPIPPLENFCFFWTFGNFGLLFMAVFFGVFLFRLLYIWLLALWIFILELYLILFQTYERLRNLNTKNRVDNLEDEPIPEQSKKIQQLQKQIDALKAKMSPRQRVGEVVIDINEEIKRPHQQSGIGNTLGRMLRKRDASPDKKKK